VSIATVSSRAQLGLDAPLVQIEAHLGSGLPGFSIVGLPAPVVRESRERVRSAILNAGYEFPPGRITVNLAPVELSKEGGRFDLPIALALLTASGQLRLQRDPAPECYGELGLGGELRPVRGLLMAAVHAARAGHELIVPAPDLDEVRLARHRHAHGFHDLRGVCDFLALPAGQALPGSGSCPMLTDAESRVFTVTPVVQYPSIDEIKGQGRAKRVLSIAAAGGHSLLMIGPPGSGKSMLASRLASLMPPLTEVEAMEVAGIASISTQGFDPAHWGRRPFRAPHHAASANAVVGGGARLRAGEISFAHHGLLFLDELPEFDHRVLEALREPLETGAITLARTAGRLELPARFQLVAAMNPCPCGYLGDERVACRCGPRRVQRYRDRISGPLLDRIDLHLEVPRVDLAELAPPDRPAATAGPRSDNKRDGHRDEQGDGQDAATLVARVREARQRQLDRQQCCNARLDAARLEEYCRAEPEAQRLLARVGERLALSARGYHRLLRVARTIADLQGVEQISAAQVAEAASCRPVASGPQCGLPGSGTV
jgi:magnesium chelatase family protein